MVRTEPRISRRSALIAVALLVTLALALTASPASAGGPYVYASQNSVGHRLPVCAQSLAVRSSPGGSGFASLYTNQTFLVQDVGPYEFGGEWVYGFAYGNVNAHGWVQNGWFCNGGW